MRVALFALISALIAAAIISPVQSQNAVTNANDVAVLNYALALENLEATYYSCYLYPYNQSTTAITNNCAGRGYNGFSQAQFLSEGYSASVYNAVLTIAQQEVSHAALLQGALGSAAVSACSYNLTKIFPQGVTNVTLFLQLAMALENVGVSAYAGAVNALTDPTLTQIAVSIADVEARHAAWLNQLLGSQPFNTSGFDLYRTPDVVATLLTGVFNQTSCVVPSGASLPSAPRPYGVQGGAYSTTGGQNATIYSGNRAQAAGVAYTQAQRANDLLVLNYALTLEQLEAAFYNAAAGIFNQTSFTAAGLPATAYTYFGIIQSNENTHVAVIRNAIFAYGGQPVGNCTYNFNTALSSFSNYLTYAAILENTGVYAYTGAANMVTDTYLQLTAAQITMIEARHAAYLNVLNTPTNQTNAFPVSRDNATAPADILNAVLATGLITSCPAFVTASNLPVLLPINGQVPSSSGTTGSIAPRSSSSSGGNGASSTSAFSAVLIVAAIIASLALVL